jgi:hypothetical protein
MSSILVDGKLDEQADDKISEEEGTPREIRAAYDPKEHKQSCDGWSLFKKAKFNQ